MLNLAKQLQFGHCHLFYVYFDHVFTELLFFFLSSERLGWHHSRGREEKDRRTGIAAAAQRVEPPSTKSEAGQWCEQAFIA